MPKPPKMCILLQLMRRSIVLTGHAAPGATVGR
jgi:hypothetical protein